LLQLKEEEAKKLSMGANVATVSFLQANIEIDAEEDYKDLLNHM
jgi:hypothetical protein